mgnify:FL=1
MLIFQNLPEEIRAKIMYGGYIIHPSAKIIKDFFNNLYIKISQNEEDMNIYQHLINIGELKETKTDENLWLMLLEDFWYIPFID